MNNVFKPFEIRLGNIKSLFRGIKPKETQNKHLLIISLKYKQLKPKQ
jgi:hypothetical protein